MPYLGSRTSPPSPHYVPITHSQLLIPLIYLTPPDLPRQIMGSKTEALQELMLAASEATFFASAPVFMHHLGQLQVRHRFFLFPRCNAM